MPAHPDPLPPLHGDTLTTTACTAWRRYPSVTFSPRQRGLAQVSVVDEGIKNVTAALRAKGMWNDTLVVFSR